MPKLTLALWLLYLAISLGLRILIQVRMTGRTGFVLSRERSSPLQLFASALFVGSLFAGLASPLLALVFPSHRMWAPLIWTGSPTLAAVGGAVYLAGVALAFTAQLTLGPSWRIGVDPNERTELIMQGAFRVVRNPIFTALFATSLGLAMLCSTPLAWFSCAVQLIALEIQVRRVEEPYLARVHGEAYRRYAARVGRFLPGIGLSRTG